MKSDLHIHRYLSIRHESAALFFDDVLAVPLWVRAFELVPRIATLPLQIDVPLDARLVLHEDIEIPLGDHTNDDRRIVRVVILLDVRKIVWRLVQGASLPALSGSIVDTGSEGEGSVLLRSVGSDDVHIEASGLYCRECTLRELSQEDPVLPLKPGLGT